MIEIRIVDSTLFAHVVGDVDMSNIGELRDEVARHVKSDALGLVVDLTEVTYLDSAGVRLLYQIDERARGRQQQLLIVVPPGAIINRTLEAAGVIGSLKIVATADQALDALGAPD
jgi:anti-anti-sigma factor